MREQTKLNAKSLAPVGSLVHRHDFRRDRPHRANDPATPNATERPRQDQPCDGLLKSKQETIKRDNTVWFTLDAPHKREPIQKINMLV